MALNRVSVPTPTAPVAPTDYAAILAQLEAKNQAFTDAAIPDLASGVIRGGRVFDVGGVLYKADSDTAISGTPSVYVKITPDVDPSTAQAAYIANLSGVTWNEAFGGYYDGSGNLVIFDEMRAVYDGLIIRPKTRMGQLSRMTLSKLNVIDIDGFLANIKTVNMSGIGAQGSKVTRSSGGIAELIAGPNGHIHGDTVSESLVEPNNMEELVTLTNDDNNTNYLIEPTPYPDNKGYIIRQFTYTGGASNLVGPNLVSNYQTFPELGVLRGFMIHEGNLGSGIEFFEKGAGGVIVNMGTDNYKNVVLVYQTRSTPF